MAVNPEYESSVYASIVKTEDNDDGTSYVYGLVTDTGEDLDKQGCDQAWLNLAIPEWYNNWGNVREMHQAKAVGVAKDLQIEPDGFYIGAKVVDAGAVQKVREGVYKGFSIGIKSPVVVRDPAFKGGLIKGGKIVEVSLVDHPANERSKFTLVKAEDAEKVLPALTEEDLIEKNILTKEFKPFTKEDDGDDGDKDESTEDDDEKKREAATHKSADGDNMDKAAVEELIAASIESVRASIGEALSKALGITEDSDLNTLVADRVKEAMTDLEGTVTAAVTKSLGLDEDNDLAKVIADTIKTVLTEQPELVKAAAIGDEGEEGTLAERVKSLEADIAEIGASASASKAYLGAALTKAVATDEELEHKQDIERKRDLYKSLETHRDPAVRDDARAKLAALGE